MKIKNLSLLIWLFLFSLSGMAHAQQAITVTQQGAVAVGHCPQFGTGKGVIVDSGGICGGGGGGTINLGTSSTSTNPQRSGEAGTGFASLNTSEINIFLGGNRSGYISSNANQNTALGYQAFLNVTTGTANTALGYQAGNLITTGFNNTIVGTTVNFVATNNNTTAIGHSTYAGGGGNQNTVIGAEAGFFPAGCNIGNCEFITAMGYQAQGSEASTVIGVQTKAAQDSVIIGYQAQDRGGPNPAQNVAIGIYASAGGSNSNNNNVVIGSGAGSNGITGSNSVLIGNQAGGTASHYPGNQNILIGNSVRNPSGGTNYYMNIGNLLQGDATNSAAEADGTETLFLQSTAASVDYAKITSSAAGNPATVTIAAAGTDTNINLNLVSKGSGTIQCNGGSCGGGGGSTALSSLTGATGANSIDSAVNTQTWTWNTLASQIGFALSSTSTAAASNTQEIFDIALSGVNGTASQTTYGEKISNAHTGATATNVAFSSSASGATNNYAAIFPSGLVGIGTNVPGNLLDVETATGSINPLKINNTAAYPNGKSGIDSYIRGTLIGSVGADESTGTQEYVLTSNGSNLQITAPATDTINFTTQGSNSAEDFQVFITTSSVNYISVAGATTGNGPVLSTVGSGTNIDLNVTPKGTGSEVLNGPFRLPNITTDTGLTDTTVCQDTTNHRLFAGSGTLGICLGTSSARYKNRIQPVVDGLSQIMKLNPVNFYYNSDKGDKGAREQYGFTAEEFNKVVPKLTHLDKDGKPNSVDILGLVPVLVKAIQQQQAEIDALKKAAYK